MTYVIGAGKSFNVVFNHADFSDPKRWNQDKESLLTDLRREFEGWDPVCVCHIVCTLLCSIAFDYTDDSQAAENNRNDRSHLEMATLQYPHHASLGFWQIGGSR